MITEVPSCTKLADHSHLTGYSRGCRCVECRRAMREWKASYDASHKDERAAYYEANVDVSRKKDVKQHAEFRVWLQDLRDAIGCEDEGPHSGSLEHHHIDPSTKLHCISQMWSHSRENVMVELNKCLVLCDSHHHKRHVAMKQIEEES